MAIQRWNPFQSLMDMHNLLDNLFGDWHPAGLDDFAVNGYKIPNGHLSNAREPCCKGNSARCQARRRPGVHANNTLSIKAEVKEESEAKDEDYFVRERRFGPYTRTVSLPSGLNSDKAEATSENGVLTLDIPKAEEAKAKEVKVKVKNS